MVHDFHRDKDIKVFTDKGNSILDLLSFSLTTTYIKTINEWVTYIYAWDVNKTNIHVVAMCGDENKEKSIKLANDYIKEIKKNHLGQLNIFEVIDD